MISSISGCATLPDIHQLNHAGNGNGNGNGAFAVAGSAGLLSPQKSAEILRRLQQEGKTDLLERHLAFMQEIHSKPLMVGNATRLLVDGASTYHAMFQEIRSAQDHINLETYIYDEEGIGERLGKLLVEKQAQGVQVNLMYDSIGSLSTRKEFFEELREQGINVCEFNPVNPLRGKIFSLNNRDHRKILVVDGKVGYTGGINISSVYSRSSTVRAKRTGTPHPWRDTQIEVRGPAAKEFQELFLDSWQRQQCPELARKNYYPAVAPQGITVVRTLGSSPRDEVNLIYIELLSAILHASKSIHMTMAYFVPDPQTVDALKNAAQRGVTVSLVLPSVSDVWSTLYAARSYYTELLQAGVMIYERKGALLHAKTVVIDGVWSTVGSSNIDFRSFLHNDEVNTIVLGKTFGDEMERAFAADLSASEKVDPARWEERSMVNRIRENLARMWAYFL
ncbi:cardiolipin synthase [Janthinobacterium sp. 17J80-10]|uniref:cardiolipin synthase n=1 Tax=Janthinobacterium sp. 17J80-10 TaxID=2497863 RepID=UPI001F50C409|nr:cardiolipin synthase [Janthinobacterium sp. 17J80-10]